MESKRIFPEKVEKFKQIQQKEKTAQPEKRVRRKHYPEIRYSIPPSRYQVAP